MRQSKLFGNTLREAPKDETSINARLLEQAGFVQKFMAGSYSYLPLGLRVIKKIEQIIREEINRLGGQELSMPMLQSREVWETTGRWEIYGPDMYQFKDHSGRELGLGPTAEEVVTPLVKRDIMSYRDLPMAVYQFQTKFRMELRAKSGLLRGREFLMKDLYSFHADDADFQTFYDKSKVAYQNIFERAGIGDQTVLTFASGGNFSKYSHEFQTLTPAGEDTIYLCKKCRVAINDEIIAEQTTCPQCGAAKSELETVRAIEVGNIFPLKSRFSDAVGLTYKDTTGKAQSVVMGCYGIGLGRLMGAIIEVHHDERGMRWPVSVAPYAIHLVRLGEDEAVRKAADELYEQLLQANKEVLYDDRDASAGVKLNDADLIGLPLRIVVSSKSLAAGGYEWKERTTETSRIVTDVMVEISKV